jgi:hypothetical protein|tara:strand:- start:2243 stop:2590 length:348 start_codon:yes stop_codon:yes gene_type:complete
MTEMFSADNLIMFAIILFSSFFVFLFNYRHDNKDKYQGNWFLISLDLFINMGMSVTGYILVVLVFDNIQQVQPYASFKYPVGFLFGLTSNVSIPIILKMFAEQLQSRLKSASKAK